MIGDRTMTAGLSAVVVLSLWLGATLVVVAVVAPAAFAVLPTRTLAGALVGRVLPVLFFSGVVVGIAAALLARGQPRAPLRFASGLAMSVACLAAQLVVTPRIERLRLEAGRPIDQLAAGDSRRATFGRLHAASVALLGVAALAAATALVFSLGALRVTTHAAPSPTLRSSPDDG
jgi:hypothetical protein